MPLYALLKQGNEKIIKNVILSNSDYQEIESRFLGGFSFYEDLMETAVSYKEDWITDHESIYKIECYNDINHLKTFDDSTISALDFNDYQSVVCLFINYNNNILVQYIDSRNIIYPEKHILVFKKFISNDTNYKLNDCLHGFFISENIHAVINDHLFFNNFYLADKALDLSQYLIEASDEQVRNFFNHKIIKLDGNIEDLIQERNRNLRKDIGRIVQSGILDKYTARYFKQKAESIKNKIKIPLDIDNDKIIIPLKKRDRNEVIKFLRNTIVQSVIDGELYRTNSKKILVSQ